MYDNRDRTAEARRRAFTLVELLVVVSILILLVGILAPSVAAMIRVARVKDSQVRCRLIEAAVMSYFSDFKDYPLSRNLDFPSTYPSGTNRPWFGGELVVVYLTGYGPDASADSKPGIKSGTTTTLAPDFLLVDDGKEGYGFRTFPGGGGKVYGPYAGAEDFKTGVFLYGSPAQESRPMFLDSFGNPFLYYRCDNPATGAITISHNMNQPVYGPSSSSYFKNSDNKYFRKDFVIISQGPDGKPGESYAAGWDAPSGPSDDITNFFSAE